MLGYKIINRRKLAATMAVDAVGTVLFAPVRLFRPSRTVDPRACCAKSVIIRTAYVGDVIMTLPMLAPLKRRFPHATHYLPHLP